MITFPSLGMDAAMCACKSTCCPHFVGKTRKQETSASYWISYLEQKIRRHLEVFKVQVEIVE